MSSRATEADTSPRLVAFLRGINLGNRRVKMATLRAHLRALALENVESYLASGNLIFDDPGRHRSDLEARIEAHLEEELGYPVATMIRSLEEVDALVDHPMVREAEAEGMNVYVTFAAAPLDDQVRAAFDALETPGDRFRVLDDAVIWLRRGGVSDSTVTTAALEAAFAGRANTRRKSTTLRRLLDRFSAV